MEKIYFVLNKLKISEHVCTMITLHGAIRPGHKNFTPPANLAGEF